MDLKGKKKLHVREIGTVLVLFFRLVMTLRKVRCEGHVEYIKATKNALKNLVGNP